MERNSDNRHGQTDDMRLGELLRLLESDAASLSPELDARVGESARQEFQEASNDVAPASSHRGRPRMVTKAFLAVAALSASLLFALFNWPPTASGDMTLGAILDQTIEAKTLQLVVSKDDVKIDVWVRSAKDVRWERTPKSYDIANGSRLWRINEQGNSVSAEDNPWYQKDTEQVDLLAMLEVDKESATAFRGTTARGTTRYAEKECSVFSFVTTRQPSLLLEAIVDLQSGELYTIAAWPGGKRNGAPAAELRLIARNVAVDETKFVVAKTLSEDGRIGKVVDAQGIVTLRPMNHRRWTPVGPDTLVKPGDWLRTDVRGANAAAVATTARFRLIGGPGSLVELQTVDRALLHAGELQVTGHKSAEGPFRLLGPNDQQVEIPAGKSAHYEIDRHGKLAEVDKKPVWLAGFEGSSSEESIGSLLCNIDGRSVPLTVGFHKVNVEIRDQIARTTIEESFVNHTNRTLEGIFHFPLPQDASISGFGMWINGELIEADVVEKQRAREIYETILRERRDPGLLEWSGGNIFKARVFPILAHSEKRIRIVYTQVLPMRANRYRYSYGLRSELLQKTPLRELSLEVLVNSALPLKKVSCSTHEVRSQQTEHSASLEFAAQEYTPTRDFEVVCEIDAQQSDVVVVPHRRGDDGYFLVQLTPPATAGNWQRELLPDGQPLEVLLVCDTSASMDSTNRREQAQFVAAVLAALGPKDRFNLAVCDVNCRWWRDAAAEPDQQATAEALDWLEQRISLGWTDLDRMAESVLRRTSDQTHVIYIGDGIVTAHDADPQAFANRLQRLTDQKRTGTFHAVSAGNSFESAVLKAIARVGGGSVRQIAGEQTPQKVAFELLNEIAQPGLRDLKVEFRGLQVAAVYPDTLPNLAAGTQQILIGRYLPQGENQSGEVVISGTRDGQEVRFASRIELTDAESGNSFIPRLWARAHLDRLLEQGTSQFIRDEIIAMSEEFHIMTPYTSLLVLETDEDRERFGVKRRFQMRDGERFFAAGRDNATFELLQQQMKRAGDWRLGLRRQILRELTGLGRDSNLLQQLPRVIDDTWPSDSSGPVSSSQPMSGWFSLDSRRGGFASGFGGGGGFAGQSNAIRGSRSINDYFGKESKDLGLWNSSSQSIYSWDEEASPGDRGEVDYELEGADDEWADANERADFAGLEQKEKRLADKQDIGFNFRQHQSAAQAIDFDLYSASRRGHSYVASGGMMDRISRFSGERGMLGGGELGSFMGDYRRNFNYVQWLNTLFPSVPIPPAEPAKATSDWQEEAVAISRSLLQPLAIENGGVEVTLHTTSRDPRWNRITGENDLVALYSPQKWLHFAIAAGSNTLVEWCDAEQRGVYSRAFQLGRERKSHVRDLPSFTPGQRAFATGPLHEVYRQYKVEIEPPADGQIVLVLGYPKTERTTETRIEIDAAKNVVTRTASRHQGKVTSSTTYEDYVQVAGAWWPGKIETLDGEGRRTSLTTQTVKQLDDEAFGKRFAQESPDREQGLVLSLPLPSVRKAEIAAADGSAAVEQRLTLLLRAMMIQKWEEAFEQLAEIEKLAPGKLGLDWLRAAVEVAARKNEEARQRLTRQAERLAGRASDSDLYLANYILDQASQIGDANEQLQLLDSLRAVFERQPASALSMRGWQARRAGLLQGLGRVEESLALRRELAEGAGWDLAAQTQYARELASAGDYEPALDWLRQEMARDEHHEHESQQLRNQIAGMLREQGRDAELVTFFQEWIAAEPTDYSVFQQYLHALSMADRDDEAEALALEWLVSARVDRQLKPAELARLNSASYHARGQRYQTYMNWMDPAWLQPLQETARFFLTHKHNFNVASTIIDDGRFSDSDESDQLRGEIAKRLVAEAAELDAARVASYVRWSVGRTDITSGQWQAIASALRKRWEEASDMPERQALDGALLQIYASHFRDSDHLPFLRARIVRAEQEDEGWVDELIDSSYVSALFNELLQRDWREEYEAEAAALFERTSASDVPSLKLATQVGELHRFVDAMLQSRYAASLKELQDTGHPENLTRTELAAKQAEFQKAAREGLADRLSAIAAEVTSADFKAWIEAERMFLDLRLDRKRQQVAAACWVILGDKPFADADEDDSTDDAAVEAMRLEQIRSLLRDRAYSMLNYLAIRRSAQKALVERLLKYVAAGVELEGDAANIWKQRRFALLVALDRPGELERELRDWIRSDEFPAAWQLALGQLLAERGKLDEAITLYETVERNSQLSPADYRALSGWYLVVDRREQSERAKVEVFKATEEYQLHNWLRQKRQPWYRNDVPLPTELDEDVLLAFRALFEKSSSPGNYASELREFYTACRDFRLLQMIPDALTGRTPQQVYPFLNRLRSDVLYEIRKEATADELLQRLKAVRGASESAIDQRALDLLEVLVERRASEVLNQPGPHIDAAVTALQRAFEHAWAEGEVPQMASLLAELGTIKHEKLNEERMRQLRELQRMTEPGTDDRLLVSWYLASALFHSADDRPGGLAVMENAMREIAPTYPEGWPAHLNTPLGGYVGLLEAAGQFAAGEQLLAKHIERPRSRQQKHWAEQRQNELYDRALRDGGQVSLGDGETLFLNLEQHLLAQAETNDDNHRVQVVYRLLQVYRTAHQRKIAVYDKRLRAFAFDLLAPILKRQTNNYGNLVRQTADTVKDLLGPREGLAFLIDRFESYPKRFEYTYESPWQQFGYWLAEWHHETDGRAADLEPRLLVIVVKELKRDLRTRNARSRYLYHNDYGVRFWKAKADVFARSAEEVLEERSGSGRSAAHIANYLYHGLDSHRRAIEILLVAHQQGLLDLGQQIKLCDYLRDRGRHAEAIPILEPIVEQHPDEMSYRTRLIIAYGKSARPEQMQTLLSATDEHFRQQGRWTESNIAQLAGCCLEVKLFAESAALYGEVIPLHQRTQPNRGIGNGTLSNYYQAQSRAYTGLGDTIQAVDAASAGIVAWGPRHHQRDSSLYWLEQALDDSKDLDAYVKHLDKQAETTGQDSPLIRQKLGVVYARRNEHEVAVRQYLAAIELQPNDVKTREGLIQSYDALDDNDDATRQTLAWLDFDRHNLELYKKLAERLKSDEALAERAVTTLVEAAPHEAEHHQALAEIRQTQERWSEAIEHWRHVARLRSLEPDGLLKLAAAQIHEKDWAAARESIEKLNGTEWPQRFSNVRHETQQLQNQIP